MKEVNNKYYIKLTAVTPLSVGAGNEEEWVKCADYVEHNGKVYVLDLHRVAEEDVDLTKLSDLFLDGDDKGIVNILAGKLETVSAFVFDLPCQTDKIKAFERSRLHNLPVVAGSSIKGALRSVLFKYLRDDETKDEEVFGTLNEGTDFMRFIKVGDIEMPATKLYNTKIFNLHSEDSRHWQGGWKHGNKNTTNSFNSSKFNTLYECIEPEISGIGSLMLSQVDLKSVKQKISESAHASDKMDILRNGLPSLFAVINNFTREYLEKERAFFEKYPADRTEEILDCIEHLLAMIPSNNSSCLMKMAAGVGFHAITGDWQFHDYTHGKYNKKENKENDVQPKSRKIAETPEGLALMGFIRLSMVTEDDYCFYVKGIEEAFNVKMQTIFERTTEQEAKALIEEQARIEKEKKYKSLIADAQEAKSVGNFELALSKVNEAQCLFPLREEASTIMRDIEEQMRLKKEANYAGCITAALEAETAGDFALAMSKAKEAIALFPNREEASTIIIRCESKAADQLLASQQAASAAAADAAREQKVASGLAALLNEKFELGEKVGQYKVADFKLCFQKVAQWTKAAKVDTLPEEQKPALLETIQRLLATPSKKEVKDIKNRKSSIWHNVEKWLSTATADELFKSIN